MPSVIDLFAGVGGLSLGAVRAGFKLLAAVENDPITLETHKKNFPNTIHSGRDVSKLKGKDLFDLAKIKRGQLDGLIGGPPCQGFSAMGKKQVSDKRNKLFMHFFRMVHETKPIFFLAENVPGILFEQFSKTRNEAFDLIRRDYGKPLIIKVNAERYGAPTKRSRIFFIGYRRSYMEDLDIGNFAPPIETDLVYVKDALQGLPSRISSRWQTEKDSWRSIGTLYASPHYVSRITGHIPDGIGDKTALHRYIQDNEVSGCFGTRHSADIKARFNRLKAGEIEPISKLVRLNPDGFCPTIRAGTNKDKGSHQGPRPIHPTLPRVITPREGARLQGFPDWFVFHPTKWHSFRQIGNSVSPLVSESLLQNIINNLPA